MISELKVFLAKENHKAIAGFVNAQRMGVYRWFEAGKPNSLRFNIRDTNPNQLQVVVIFHEPVTLLNQAVQCFTSMVYQAFPDSSGLAIAQEIESQFNATQPTTLL